MGVDILAIGAHPDDVDMIAGGTLAKLADRGREIVIADLTRGETATRGTAERRSREAAAAANVLGAAHRENLDLGDGVLENNMASRRKIIELVRTYRPVLLLTHHERDLHPDHAAAGRMVRDAFYPGGFSNFPADGSSWRPNELLFFMAHTPFEPGFVVDISNYHDRKMNAVKCFVSQLHKPRSNEPATGISKPGFLPALEGRARYFGSLIGVEYGEPFLPLRTVPVDDPVDLYQDFRGYSS